MQQLSNFTILWQKSKLKYMEIYLYCFFFIQSCYGLLPLDPNIIMAHSCAHLRNWFLWWNVSEAGLGRAERDIYPECLLPAAPALRKAPWVPNRQLSPARTCPFIKRNDSTCALFEFDVLVMHYTIKLIWQFPLNLIKYLCRQAHG